MEAAGWRRLPDSNAPWTWESPAGAAYTPEAAEEAFRRQREVAAVAAPLAEEAAPAPAGEGSDQRTTGEAAQAPGSPWQKVIEAREAVAVADEEVEDAKEVLKLAKARHEAAVTRVMRLIDEARVPPERTLFDDEPNFRSEPTPSSESQTDDSWRIVSLNEVLAELPEGIRASLREADLTTMGQLADFTEDNPLTDLAGIGPTKAEKIEQALEAFWERWRAAGGVTDEPLHEDETPLEPAAAAGDGVGAL